MPTDDRGRKELDAELAQVEREDRPVQDVGIRGDETPPRLPLRVRVSRTRDTEEPPLAEQGWIEVRPDDPGYEVLYQEALASLRIDGSPMPYAEDTEQGADVDDGGPAASQ